MKQVFCLLILITLLVSCFSNTQTYNIITYNIRYDNPSDGENKWDNRKDFLSNQIAYNNPDIFGIQEGLHHQVKYLDSVFTNYNYIGVGRDDGKTKGEYSAIFYNKEKLEVIKEGTFWLSETPAKISIGWDASMERICTYALFKNKNIGTEFFVFNTHFDHVGNVARVKSVELILQKIDELNVNKLPVILMGDFNLKPETKPIQLLSNTLNDAKIVSRLDPVGSEGTFNGFNFEEQPKDRIDYIFTSRGNISVLEYVVLSDSRDGKYLSDHLPVFVKIEF